VPDPKRRGAKSERILLRGDVPSPISPPSGCRFHTRCWKATEICRTTEPQLVELRPGQRVACHHPENFADQAPQDTVLLSVAREAAELVAEEVLAESAATSAAVAAVAAGTAGDTDAEAAGEAADTAAQPEAEAAADVEATAAKTGPGARTAPAAPLQTGEATTEAEADRQDPTDK